MSKNIPVISVIVPVYNAEKYLDRCVNSILQQSFRNYELILVDDGSKDGSGIICDKFASQDSRVRVIHKQNGGVSQAREYGIAQAKGEYIAFVDADDYVKEDYLGVLYYDANKYHADIACCDCIEMASEIQTDRIHTVINSRIITVQDEYIRDYIENKELYGYVVWGKIIRTQLLLKQRFKNIRFGEDTVYMLNLFGKNPITSLNNYQGYVYVRNADSVTVSAKRKDSIMFLNHILIGEACMMLSEKCSKKTQTIAVNEYANRIYSALSLMIKCGDIGNFIKYHENICEHIDKVLKFACVRPKYRFMLQFYKHSPQIYWKIISRVLENNYE
jgi:glycosyltransferase involved in cell wall biosynthesis